MHDNNIYHRDIKPENILISNFNLLKLSDFGHSKNVENINKSIIWSTNNIGTPDYWPPEAYQFNFVKNGKSDIWSLGLNKKKYHTFLIIFF